MRIMAMAGTFNPEGASPDAGGAQDQTLTNDDRTYATFLHLAGPVSMLVVGPFCFAGPLIMWLIKKDQSGYLDDHGREALNFTLSLIIYSIILTIATIVTLGLGSVLFLGLFVLGAIGAIRGSIAANRGEYYRNPMCLRLIGPPSEAARADARRY